MAGESLTARMGEGKISFGAFSIYYRYRFGITSGSALLTNNTAGQ
jgi:hypothetical protein